MAGVFIDWLDPQRSTAALVKKKNNQGVALQTINTTIFMPFLEDTFQITRLRFRSVPKVLQLRPC